MSDQELIMGKIHSFFEFAEERHKMYLRRFRYERPKPWTVDPILQNYRFCNVYRELDKVTIWIRENWRKPYADHPNLWFAMCLARHINHPETLEEIGFPEDGFDPAVVCDVMQAKAARGEKVYTAAYLTGGGNQGGMDKPTFTCFKVLLPVWEQYRKIKACYVQETGDKYRMDYLPSTLQETTDWFSRFYGWSGFLSYEVVTDLRHTRYLRDAPDIMTWANPGPGAQRGLHRIFYPDALSSGTGKASVGSVKGAEAQRLMRELLDYSRHEMFWKNDELFPMLEMRDIEHLLCEYDKYERVRLGQGAPRQKYNGI